MYKNFAMLEKLLVLHKGKLNTILTENRMMMEEINEMREVYGNLNTRRVGLRNCKDVVELVIALYNKDANSGQHNKLECIKKVREYFLNEGLV